jgi:Aromatic-ring-opening dioxygenase LigAB, LigA subunit
MTPRKGYELDRLLFKVKKDDEFRRRFFSNFEDACTGFKLSSEEKAALRKRDFASLSRLGVKPELILALAKATM